MIPNFLTSISADPKSGKTHLCFTWPDPIKVFSFDGGADYVATKFPDKVIDIENFQMPIIESDSDASWAPPIWDDFYTKYKAAVEGGEYQTIVIDTATTAHTILNQAVFEWLKEDAAEKGNIKKKLAVNEYHTRNLLMKALFDLPKNKGINLVTTQYLGEVWKSPGEGKMAQPTGETKVSGWNQTEAFADVNIEMRRETKGGKTSMVSRITSTRFDDLDLSVTGTVLKNTDYDELVALLFGE